MTLTGTPAARAASAKRRAASIVVEAADRDRRAGQIRGLPGAIMQHDGAARRIGRERTKLRAWGLGVDVDVGAGRRDELSLPRRTRAVAGDHGAPAVEREEDRQPRERLHARRSAPQLGCVTRSWLMSRLSSGRHDPQLVPARSVRPISATFLAVPAATAWRTVSTATPKQAQITGAVAPI